MKSSHHQILIIGGGTAGITVAAQILKRLSIPDIAILDPAKSHYYQPLWTLVGGGVFDKQKSKRNMKDVIPPGVTWIAEAATEFAPGKNLVRCSNGDEITYNYLVVAPGLQLDWDAIPGVTEGLGTHGICSNYSYQHVSYTWDCIHNFKGGTAIFTQPGTPVKCGGAPQKIMYLAEDYFRSRSKVRDQSKVLFASAMDSLFAVEKYRKTLEKVIKREGIEVRLKFDLTSVDPDTQTATFTDIGSGETEDIHFDLLHVTPPMSAPDFVKNSPLAADTGWVSVDPKTLRHTRFENIFGIGDASDLPTSKTGAAIRKQAPVLVDHLIASIMGETSNAVYSGYTSCPLVTGYGKMVLAEFGYDKEPDETFPVDQSKERWSMWLFKKFGLPWLYWNLMLKGKI